MAPYLSHPFRADILTRGLGGLRPSAFAAQDMRANAAPPNPHGLDIYGCPALARRYKRGVGPDRHLVSRIPHDS